MVRALGVLSGCDIVAVVRGRQGKFRVAFLPIVIIAFFDGGVVTVLRNRQQLSPVLASMGVARALGFPDPVDRARRAVRSRRVARAEPAPNLAIPAPPSRRRPA